VFIAFCIDVYTPPSPPVSQPVLGVVAIILWGQAGNYLDIIPCQCAGLHW